MVRITQGRLENKVISNHLKALFLPQLMDHIIIHSMCWDEPNAKAWVTELFYNSIKMLNVRNISAVHSFMCVWDCSLSSVNRKPIIPQLCKCLLKLCSILMNNGLSFLFLPKKQSMIYATIKSLSTLPFSTSCPLRLLGKQCDKARNSQNAHAITVNQLLCFHYKVYCPQFMKPQISVN